MLDYFTNATLMTRSARTTEIDAIRFQDKDLSKDGTLDFGQFGVVRGLRSFQSDHDVLNFWCRSTW
jgi:hypothetical protein